ncbi:glycerol-3-phosphate 1-O-acyltransferase PlsY [bacterium]|nr:glycerol-3-phosphate 1-O-acyltransferase PlsY [bacterium]
MNQDTIFILLALFSYICASTPFGFLIAKAKGVDIRKTGSGNVGGTNILRTFGFSFFLLVVILDIAKVATPVLLGKYLLLTDWQIVLISLLAIFGNMFSFWLGFKGGKAVSAVFAIFACLVGFQNALMFLFVWGIMLYVLKIMSLTNLIMCLIIPIAIWQVTQSIPFVILGIIFVPVIWWAHRENIKRLLKGSEPKIIRF